MPEKMYYDEDEAAQKLGVDVDGLNEMVQQGQLRAYQDGAKRMFRGEDVESLASTADTSDEIELSPADTSTDAISLESADQAPAGGGKEDTVITSEGISIFDDEDLEIEAADPLAKTQIAPSIEDQMSLEGVGSGSGLLDLTRESDDTSLGAEVLDHIDMESQVGSDIGPAIEPQPVGGPGPVTVAAQPLAESVDPSAGLFGGFALGCVLVMILGVMAAVAVAMDALPDLLVQLKNNMMFVLIGAVVVVAICAVVGLLVGKSAADRQLAMRRMGA